MQKILLSADFLATKESEQANNTRWFKDILEHPIFNSTKIKPEEFKSAIFEDNGFVRAVFFEKSGITLDPSEMQFDFEATKITEDSIEYLKRHITKDTLVIGYEFSAGTREILNRAKITYIDIWLHPVRYLDDVLFAFDTNHAEIKTKLHGFNVNEETYYSYANRLKVQNYKGFRRAKLDLNPNSALFVGQTLYDKAISYQGKMLSLLDFKEKFSALCETHDHVYYSRHPFVKTGDEEVLAYVKRHRNVTITEEPSYFLLASDDIKTVASLSSSVVHEARYFSKKTEFFFRPVIEIGKTEMEYTSVYQSFLFSHFWSEALSPVMDTVKVDQVEYMDSKDKIRDMLSFYWGYRNIDKVESLKQTVGALYEKKNSSTPQTLKAAGNWRAEIDKSSIVSFDVFDTLISRQYYFPTDVFAFMEARARELTGGKVRNFRANRITAETSVREARHALDGKQEIPTIEVYDSLAQIYDLTSDEKHALLNLELDAELKVSIRRDAGWRMYRYAQKMGKEIIAISDTTHDLAFIKKLLEKSGYIGFSKIYVSSESGLRKHEGEIFNFVADDLKVYPADIFHVGDNATGDISSATKQGLRCFQIPRASVHLESAEGFTPLIQGIKTGKTEFDSFLFSIIARKYFDTADQIKSKTLFNGEAFNLGFSALGPAITGFVTWIYNQAKQEAITDIYFLSRDGLIAKKAYDILFGNVPHAPKSHYIFASRRASRVATIYCLADILEIARKHIYSTTLNEYLWSRFGLQPGSVSLEVLSSFGFESENQPIGQKFQKDSIIALVTHLKQQILDVAKSERDAYVDYLKSNNLTNEGKHAVVDIGYAGSMQAALQRLTGINFLGLYFATFSTARSEALDTNDMRGYVAHLAQPNGAAYGIQKYRFVYEALFCAPHDSFVCIQDINGQKTPIFDQGDNDELRRKLITEVHGGVEAFAYTLSSEHAAPEKLDITPESATRVLDYWLMSPTIDDALILEGLQFHDPMGPSSIRYIVPFREMRSQPDIAKSCVWPEGIRAVQRLKGPSSAPKPTTTVSPQTPNVSGAQVVAKPRANSFNPLAWLVQPIEARIIKKTCSDRKIDKYVRDRAKFFADAKKPLVRNYGKYSSFLFS